MIVQSLFSKPKESRVDKWKVESESFVNFDIFLRFLAQDLKGVCFSRFYLNRGLTESEYVLNFTVV